MLGKTHKRYAEGVALHLENMQVQVQLRTEKSGKQFDIGSMGFVTRFPG